MSAPGPVIQRTMQELGCVHRPDPRGDYCGSESCAHSERSDWTERGCGNAVSLADAVWEASITYFLEQRDTPTIKVEDAQGVLPIVRAQALLSVSDLRYVPGRIKGPAHTEHRHIVQAYADWIRDRAEKERER